MKLRAGLVVRDAARKARLLTMRVWDLSPRNHFLDFAQLLLAEEHLLADEKCRRTERAALDRGLGGFDQLGLDVGILRAGKQFCRIETGGAERLRRHGGIVHLLRLHPHVVKRGLDILLEY